MLAVTGATCTCRSADRQTDRQKGRRKRWAGTQEASLRNDAARSALCIRIRWNYQQCAQRLFSSMLADCSCDSAGVLYSYLPEVLARTQTKIVWKYSTTKVGEGEGVKTNCSKFYRVGDKSAMTEK